MLKKNNLFLNRSAISRRLLNSKDTATKQLRASTSGEGNGNPLQYSCLENSMDGGAWWAAVQGVAKNRTRLRDFTFFLSIVTFGEGNSNPLLCSCLENAMDGEAWWAAIYGVAKSWTRLSNTHTHTHTQDTRSACHQVTGAWQQSKLTCPLSGMSKVLRGSSANSKTQWNQQTPRT